jgi:hypothetical protein
MVFAATVAYPGGCHQPLPVLKQLSYSEAEAFALLAKVVVGWGYRSPTATGGASLALHNEDSTASVVLSQPYDEQTVIRAIKAVAAMHEQINGQTV